MKRPDRWCEVCGAKMLHPRFAGFDPKTGRARRDSDTSRLECPDFPREHSALYWIWYLPGLWGAWSRF